MIRVLNRFTRTCRLWRFGLFCAGAWAGQTAHGAVERYLFLDPAFLTETDRATLSVNPPVRKEAVLQPDRPWESLMVGFFLTVHEEAGVLRMWYMCGDHTSQAKRSYPIAYAESTDGINWRKPDLGIVDYAGSRANNLVGLPYWEGVVFRDPRGQGAQQYVYVTNLDGEGVVRFHSPDGLRWSRDTERLLPFRADTQNVTFWDERLKTYVLYLRAWDMAPGWDNRLRVVARLTADDLSAPLPVVPSGRGDNPRNPKDRPRIAGEVPQVFGADARDPRPADVYNMSVQPYPLDSRWYVAFPSFYRHVPGGTAVNDGRIEVHFAGSSDGIAWHRYDRRPYAGLELAGTENSSVAYMGTGMVVRGDEIWQYGTGYRLTHKVEGRERQTDGVIYRYVQRIDGFVSLDFPVEGGRALTVPVVRAGGRLFVNVDTGGLGTLRVGLRDAEGKVISGFAVEDCDPIRVNATRAEVSWRGKTAIAGAQDRTVRVELSGDRAKVFSFYFE